MKIIFDFDGTIVDSMPRLRELGSTIIEDYHEVPAYVADDMYMATIGQSFREQLDALFPDDAYTGLNERAADAFYDQQEEIYETVLPHAGVIDTLLYLNEQNIPYAVVSSTDTEHVSKTLSRILPEFKGEVRGRDMGPKYAQLRQSGGKSDVFIGDALFDGDMGDLAGMRFIGVAHTKSIVAFREAGFTAYDSIPLAVDAALRGPETGVFTHGGTTSAGGYIAPENVPNGLRG